MHGASRPPAGTRTVPSLTATQLGVRVLVLGGLALVFVTAMLSPAVDGLGDLPDHVLGKIDGGTPALKRAPAPPPLTAVQRAKIRYTVVRTAAHEVGVREWANDNRGDRIVTYRRAVTGVGENPRTPEPWCADFVSWAWKRAGYRIGFGGRGSDYVAELVAWGKLTRRWREARTGYRPEPGDLIVYRSGGQRYGHAGLVAKVGTGRVKTIEGNYQDRVMRRSVKPWDGEVQGFVRPL